MPNIDIQFKNIITKQMFSLLALGLMSIAIV
ncbi:hypothetical protein Ga0123461_0095 [Mariprofundus aestuarium]|uniref:Uncharacterized protein n=1 Tax=Mariprofundus aestuarium TaxID=1921086 RepID=A0A2K8KUV8_MARES|nr:hypothetical protein Ga0123461_0095 [Mariprofundus aestuarium]